MEFIHQILTIFVFLIAFYVDFSSLSAWSMQTVMTDLLLTADPAYGIIWKFD